MEQADSDEEDTRSSFQEDEEELDKTRTFLLALQELKSLRPQLYQAADYCEHQYLFGDNKQGVLDNLKDYSVKALVNAVDHLGTVAYKLNDLIAQHQHEVDVAQISTSALAQRLRACHEHSDREGLKQQSIAKTMQVNYMHYKVPEHLEPVAPKRAGQKNAVLMRETFDLSQPSTITRIQIPQSPEPHAPPNQTAAPQPSLDASLGPQSWYFEKEIASTTSGVPSGLLSTTSVSGQQPPPSALSHSRGSFLNRAANASFRKGPSLSTSFSFSANKAAGGQSASVAAPSRLSSTPMPGYLLPSKPAPAQKTGNLDLERTMFLTPSLPVPEDSKPSRGKGILRSLLGRRT